MLWFWIGFILLIALCLAIDLGLFNRKQHAISIREALTWTCVWVSLSFAFSGFIYLAYGHNWFGMSTQSGLAGSKAAGLYIGGYLLEWMLSVDNLFVIAVILGFFKVPPAQQHRVLVWGIIAAIVLRGVFIVSATQIIDQFHFLIYILAVGLLWIAFKMLSGDDSFDPSKHWVTKLLYRWFRVTDQLHGSQFLVRIKEPDGAVHTWLTPLAAALIVVNIVDVIFAIDSIPAVMGLTTESFIVFTSNIFAVLGLRSMYFALSALLGKFHYLKYALAIILGMIGVKMLAETQIEHYLPLVHEHMISITLGFIVVSLAVGVIASLLYAKKHPEQLEPLDREAEAESESNASA